MSNMILGFPNRIDEATLSGGAWAGTLPLGSLQTRVIQQKARSVSAATAATQFAIDLGAQRNIRLIGLIAHNFSLAARYRITASNAADFSLLVADSGWKDCWPEVYPASTLEWEDDNWWNGKYTQEQLAGVNWNVVHILPANKLARYWKVEIDDTVNLAGYVELGRVFIGAGWQPFRNKSYGATLGVETGTTVDEALGGAEYFDVRTAYRVARFSLEWMSADEGLAQSYELDRRAGIDKEVLYIYDPDDSVHALRRQFLGRLRQLNPLEFPYYSITKKAYEVKELL